jgi:hypothetical protein
MRSTIPQSRPWLPSIYKVIAERKGLRIIAAKNSDVTKPGFRGKLERWGWRSRNTRRKRYPSPLQILIECKTMYRATSVDCISFFQELNSALLVVGPFWRQFILRVSSLLSCDIYTMPKLQSTNLLIMHFKHLLAPVGVYLPLWLSQHSRWSLGALSTKPAPSVLCQLNQHLSMRPMVLHQKHD